LCGFFKGTIVLEVHLFLLRVLHLLSLPLSYNWNQGGKSFGMHRYCWKM